MADAVWTMRQRRPGVLKNPLQQLYVRELIARFDGVNTVNTSVNTVNARFDAAASAEANAGKSQNDSLT
jgi:hypothetical protein